MLFLTAHFPDRHIRFLVDLENMIDYASDFNPLVVRDGAGVLVVEVDTVEKGSVDVMLGM